MTVIGLPASKDMKGASEKRDDIRENSLKKDTADDEDAKVSTATDEEAISDNNSNFIIRKNEIIDYRVDEDHFNSTSFYSDDVSNHYQLS